MRVQEETQPTQPVVDASQFEGVFEHFQAPICNYIYRLVGNRDQANDLAQDVFMKAYKSLTSGVMVHPDALSSWIYRIATNTATGVLRRRRLIAWMPINDWDADDGSCFEHDLAEHEEVQQTLDTLPYKYAACLLLQSEGFSCDEIASILGVTSAAVKMRLKRGKEKFIKLYQNQSEKMS